MAILAILALSSCEKENLGKFNPKWKISKVYSESDGHYLKEQWLWNDDQLHQVEYYRKNGTVDQTCRYLYENDLLSRIEMDDQHSDFEYDGKKLTSIKTYYGDQLMETYSLSFEKQKLSHISIRKSAKSVSEKTPDILQLFSPGCESPFDLCRSVKGVKREHYDYSTAEIDFTWDGNNVKDMKMTINRPDSVQKLTFSYVYDENVNPKKNFFSLLLDHVLLNDEYPTKIYSTSLDEETFMEKKELIYSYEYLY